MILILPSNHNLARVRMAFHDATVDACADTVGVGIEAFVIGIARSAILLGHAGCVRIVSNAYAIVSVQVAATAAGVGRLCCHESGGSFGELKC